MMNIYPNGVAETQPGQIGALAAPYSDHQFRGDTPKDTSPASSHQDGYPSLEDAKKTLGKMEDLLNNGRLSSEWQQEIGFRHAGLHSAQKGVLAAIARCDEAIIRHRLWGVQKELEEKTALANRLTEEWHRAKQEVDRLQHESNMLHERLAASGVRSGN